MPQFRVICVETVSTEFFVDSPSQARLEAWLEEEGADAVSELTERQEVRERDYQTEPWHSELGADYNTEEEEEESENGDSAGE